MGLGYAGMYMELIGFMRWFGLASPMCNMSRFYSTALNMSLRRGGVSNHNLTNVYSGFFRLYRNRSEIKHS